MRKASTYPVDGNISPEGSIAIRCPECGKSGYSFLRGNGTLITWCRRCRINYETSNQMDACLNCLKAGSCDPVLRPKAV